MGGFKLSYCWIKLKENNMKNQSWKSEIKTPGDRDFVTNGLRFVTEEEAQKYQDELLSRWFVKILDKRVSESTDKPNYIFIRENGAVSMESDHAVRWTFHRIYENKNEPSLNYAVEYAKYGMVCPDDELKIQALYTLGNISRWKGDTAKKCRAILKAYTGTK